MSDRDTATHTKGEKQNKVTQEPRTEDEDLPPPYPGIPGADITSETAPLCPGEPRDHLQVTSQPGARLHMPQPWAQPNESGPGYYPQPVPSAPPEQDSAPQKEPSPISPKTNAYCPQQYAHTPSCAPYEGLYRDSQPKSYPDYPRQQPPASGSYRPLSAQGGSHYPTYVHPTAAATTARPVASARRGDGCCDSEECANCAACMMCTVACCDCFRLLVEIFK